MRPVVATIDLVNLWAGRITCLLLTPVMAAMITEVFSRSMFGFLVDIGYEDTARTYFGPTLWSYEVTRMIAGAMFMLGAGYALMRGVHIRADFIYRKWSPKTQATVDAILYMAFYFPALLLFLYISGEYTLKAWLTGERAMDTTFMAPLAPARTAMPLGILFLVLQGVSELLKCLYRMGHVRERKFVLFLPFYLIILTITILSVLFPSTLPAGTLIESLTVATGFGEMPSATIGLVMLAVMLLAIFVGFPISFTLIFLGFTFGAWGFSSKLVFYLQTLQFNSVMLDETLAAVPLFVFMGIMMEKAGLMERLFTSVQLMLSRTHGALYLAVLFVSTIFAAATGIVGASVTILGIMAAKTMNRSGYNVQLAAGTITAGGTLGILIPPSIMLVVMGPVLEIPVTDLFAAAIIPGLMLAFLYALYALGRCWLNPTLGPPLAEDERPNDIAYVAREFFLGLVPPALLVASALGSILMGWATPTEAAGCGAFGAVLLTLAYGKFTFRGGYDALIKTLEITVLIMFLVAASNFFGAVFSRLGTPSMLTELLLSLDMPPTVILIMVMALIFILGWPLEWVPIVLIIVPILIPVVAGLAPAMAMSETQMLTWFGILVAVNLQTAWLSPPVALSAYFLKGVVPEWDLKDIYLGMMQFMVIQLIGLILVFTFPKIALWLPNYIYGG
ncbi:TRAP transporter large permease subunit [Algicella marina]|uniref:TRAP transporter large permease subunit n=2 Tax=Algicella marina TaxID=2683284 RepID=A0A6P1T6L3_9RHOB|nr:TRAP transporter large permease subunit [Algicella marina]